MFIRSQNRDVLVNVNDICFNKLYIHPEIIYQFRCYGYGDDYYILGEYSTEEKALKVLDEIQRKIECPDSSLISPAASINYYHLSVRGNFYQMPADDEVEV